MFYCCETGFFTFKTEVNGMWLLLFQRVMVLMLERYGCPILGRGENIAIKLYNRSYGDLYQLNGFRLTRSAWNAGITISDWLTVSWFLCLWFICAW